MNEISSGLRKKFEKETGKYPVLQSKAGLTMDFKYVEYLEQLPKKMLGIVKKRIKKLEEIIQIEFQYNCILKTGSKSRAKSTEDSMRLISRQKELKELKSEIEKELK